VSRRSSRASRAPHVSARGARARRSRSRAIAIGAAALVGLVAVVALFGERVSGGRVRMPWSQRGAAGTASPMAALDLPTPRAYLDAAVAANAAGDVTRLSAIVDAGLAKFPTDPSLLLARGAALNNISFRVERTRGRLVPAHATSLERVRAAQAALDAYGEVATRYPAAAEPVGELGLVLVTWGLPEDGRRYLERAYDLGDRRPEVLNALGAVDRTQRLE
jgi:hypothetical protein